MAEPVRRARGPTFGPEPQSAIQILPKAQSADGIPPWPTTIPTERTGLREMETGTQFGAPLAASSTARTKAPTSGSFDPREPATLRTRMPLACTKVVRR